MLKQLVEKQLMEIFRQYFYDAKKNCARPKGIVALYFVLFFGLVFGILGGIGYFVARFLGGELHKIQMEWLFFLLISGFSIVIGVFGSVFNTYAGLYLSKDNELLLAMPIPFRDIVLSRVLGVYAMGTMYSAAILIPALLYYWIRVEFSAATFVCGLFLLVIVSLIVWLLSCLLGFVVAKISQKLKNRSIVTVLVSLAGIGLYYYLYFNAANLLKSLLENAWEYEKRIKESAYPLYLFGTVGCGNVAAALGFFAGIAVAVLLVWYLLLKTFLSIATSTAVVKKAKYVEKDMRQDSPFGTLVRKELGKFVSNPSYMLNCGLGALFMLLMAGMLLFRGKFILQLLTSVFGKGSDSVVVVAMFMITISMTNIVTPSVSLEGKNIWILQSFPVSAKTVLRAKMAAHLLVAGIATAISLVCALIPLEKSPAESLTVIVLVVSFLVFSAAFDSVCGICLPNLTWVNEITPIKKGLAMFISMFGGWIFPVVFVAVYFEKMHSVGIIAYLCGSTVFFAGAAIAMIAWLDRKGAKRFEEL